MNELAYIKILQIGCISFAIGDKKITGKENLIFLRRRIQSIRIACVCVCVCVRARSYV